MASARSSIFSRNSEIYLRVVFSFENSACFGCKRQSRAISLERRLSGRSDHYYNRNGNVNTSPGLRWVSRVPSMAQHQHPIYLTNQNGVDRATRGAAIATQPYKATMPVINIPPGDTTTIFLFQEKRASPYYYSRTSYHVPTGENSTSIRTKSLFTRGGMRMGYVES